MGNNQFGSITESSPGFALILGHSSYKDPQITPKDGNKVDLQRLNQILPQFGFKMEIHCDLTAEQIKNKISQVSTADEYSNHSCLLVIVLTHGSYGGALWAYDTYYYTSDVWNPIANCSNFNGKPKLLLFQACRGHLHEQVMQSGDLPSNTKEKLSNNLPYFICLPNLPCSNEFLIAYSSYENTVSISNKITGSWYVETLCSELSNIHSEVSLESILTRVTYLLVNRSMGGFAQTSAFVSLLPSQLRVSVPTCIDAKANLTLCSVEPTPMMFSTIDSSGTTDCAANIININEDLECNLTTDGSGNTNKLLNIPSYYPCQGSTPGRVLIFHTTLYSKDATLLQQTLSAMQMDVEEPQLIVGDNLVKTLHQVSQQSNLSEVNCLMIVILSSITSYNTESQESHVASQLISSTWSPFIASKCPNLHTKPKIFLYLDKLDTTDNTSHSDEKDLNYDSGSLFGQNVTDHVDFLHVIGFGRGFFHALLDQLVSGHTNQQDMFKILTSAKQIAVDQSTDIGITVTSQTYFKSTLSMGFKIPSIEHKSTTDNATAVDIEENKESKFDKIAFKVDREVNRALGDVNETVESIAEHLPKLEEQLVVQVPKIRESFKRLRDLWK